MHRPTDPPHSWHLIGPPSGEADDLDAVDSALARGQATLAYGEHCLEFTYSLEEGDACFLRLEEVGRLTATGSGRAILVFARDGYHAEQRIVPCRDALDAQVLQGIDPEALQAIGLALLDDASRVLDDEEQLP